MRVILRVVGGKNDGREIKISVPEFIIGRGDKAHLRPSSDLISRQHCKISVRESTVTVEDMGSRNGSFLNGEPLTEPKVVKSGDSIRVGRLQFEMVIDPVRSGARRPKVNDVVEAAARTASSRPARPGTLEESVGDWLMDDEDESVEPPVADVSETIQFSIDETQEVIGPVEDLEPDSGEIANPQETIDSGDKRLKNQPPGKLPPVPKTSSHGNSTLAADDVLRQFFKRR